MLLLSRAPSASTRRRCKSRLVVRRHRPNRSEGARALQGFGRLRLRRSGDLPPAADRALAHRGAGAPVRLAVPALAWAAAVGDAPHRGAGRRDGGGRDRNAARVRSTGAGRRGHLLARRRRGDHAPLRRVPAAGRSRPGRRPAERRDPEGGSRRPRHDDRNPPGLAYVAPAVVPRSAVPRPGLRGGGPGARARPRGPPPSRLGSRSPPPARARRSSRARLPRCGRRRSRAAARIATRGRRTPRGSSATGRQSMCRWPQQIPRSASPFATRAGQDDLRAARFGDRPRCRRACRAAVGRKLWRRHRQLRGRAGSDASAPLQGRPGRRRPTRERRLLRPVPLRAHGSLPEHRLPRHEPEVRAADHDGRRL